MPVLEDERQRSLVGQPLEVPAGRAEDLTASRLSALVAHLLRKLPPRFEREQRGEVRQELIGLLAEKHLDASLELRPPLRIRVLVDDAGVRLDDLDEGPVTDRAAEWKRTAREPPYAVGRMESRVGHET